MPTLSVILPTYNGARFLRQQIDSILEQSVASFELLIIDDGSTDRSSEIIDDYVRLDRRVRRLPSMGNAGQRLRIAQLMDEVSTEFIAFADQDDVWESDRNGKLLSAIGEKALAFGRSQLIDADGQSLGLSLLESLKIDPLSASPLNSLFSPLVSAHAAIVRRSWFDRAVLTGAMPFDHSLGLAAQLSLGLVYVDDAVVQHRIHGGNQMNSHSTRDKTGKLLSVYRLKASTSFVLLNRLSLFTVFDQMSRCTAISNHTRQLFLEAADACHFVWFQRLDSRIIGGRKLERKLHTMMDEFSLSPSDLYTFTRRIRSVTMSQLAPFNITKAMRIYASRKHLPAYQDN